MAPCSCHSSVLCLLPSLLLLLQLPPGGSPEQFHVIAPSDSIVAVLGEDVTLSCFLDPVMSAENMELRWFRSTILESVFIYQDRQERSEELMAQYAGRTLLVEELLSKGEATVHIHKVQAADNGLYTCSFRDGDFYEQASLELEVAGVVSAPQVHITGSEEDGVRVACTASGWFPEPQVQWRHPRGEQFLEFSKVYTQDTEGLFSVEAALVVRDSSAGSMTCSILNPTLSQEKAMAIVIPEPFFPRASLWKPAFLVSLPLLLLLLLGAACYTRREHSTHMWKLQEQRNLRQEKEQDRQTKEEALKDTGQRKAAYLAAWRKAQLYAEPSTTPPEWAGPSAECPESPHSCHSHHHVQLSQDWRKEQFRAWSVTLDPSPFHSNIVLSPDKKSMACNHDGMKNGFLAWGLEGITSGRCYWEVEVRSRDSSEWVLGVWREDEKTRYKAPSPMDGFWVVGLFENVFKAFTSPCTLLPLRQVPHRMGVFLDYAQGDVSFYDMTDGSHIFSFPPEFLSGTLFPYFVCCFGDVSMTLCPLETGPQKPFVPMDNPPLEDTVGPSGEGIPSGSGVDGAPPELEAPLLPLHP